MLNTNLNLNNMWEQRLIYTLIAIVRIINKNFSKIFWRSINIQWKRLSKTKPCLKRRKTLSRTKCLLKNNKSLTKSVKNREFDKSA